MRRCRRAIRKGKVGSRDKAVRRLGDLHACESGAISIVAAASLTVLIGLLALSFDFGVAYIAKRQLQQAVDFAALKAVTDPSNAASLAETTVADNVDPSSLANPVSAVAGQYPPSGYNWTNIGSLPLAARFVPGGSPGNALQVSAQENVPVYLARLFYSGNWSVSAQATAYNQALTQLTVGAGAMAIDNQQSTVNNALLSSLLGTNISLDAVSYQGLVNANVRLFNFLDALATIAGTPQGDYSALLATNVTFADVVAALTAAISADPTLAGSADALNTALNALNTQIGAASPFTLGSLLQLDDVTAAHAVGSELNLFAFLQASAEAINATSQPTTVVSIPLTDGSITLRTAVTEPTQSSAIGGVGITASTAEIRLYMTITPAAPINVLGMPIAVQFPIYLTSIGGQATVTGLDCPGPDPAEATVTVSAQAGPASASTADIDTTALYQSVPPTMQPAQIAYMAGLVKITASGTQTLNSSPATLTFVSPFSASDTQRVSWPAPLSSIMTNLVTNDSYSVTALGLPIPTSVVMNQLTPLLNLLAPEADAVIADTLGALGASVAYMDVTVPYVRCSNPVLAQ